MFSKRDIGFALLVFFEVLFVRAQHVFVRQQAHHFVIGGRQNIPVFPRHQFYGKAQGWVGRNGAVFSFDEGSMRIGRVGMMSLNV